MKYSFTFNEDVMQMLWPRKLLEIQINILQLLDTDLFKIKTEFQLEQNEL